MDTLFTLYTDHEVMSKIYLHLLPNFIVNAVCLVTQQGCHAGAIITSWRKPTKERLRVA